MGIRPMKVVRRLVPFLVLGLVGAAVVVNEFGGSAPGSLSANLSKKLHVPDPEVVLRSIASHGKGGANTVTARQAIVEGNGANDSVVVGDGATVPITFTYAVTYYGSLPSPMLTLERKLDGGAWTATTAHVKTEHAGEVVAWTPTFSPPTAGTASTVVQYRMVSEAYTDVATGGVSNTSTSPTFSVRYENQARYTGTAAAVYRAIRAYCPTTAVHVQHLVSTEAGQYTTGGLVIEIADTYGLWSEGLTIDQRAVALHECSHERQWMNYGSTEAGRTTMLGAAARYFSTSTKPTGITTPYRYQAPTAPIAPVEHAADCGAQAMNPGGYLGYGGWCSRRELREGRRLLLGHRY